MSLLKKFVLALFFSISMLLSSTISIAEGITTESVLAAMDLTIKTADEVVVALENGEDAEKIEALYRQVKYAIKDAVVSDSTVAVPRSKGNARNSASRRAFRKGDIEKAKQLAIEASDYYKAAKANIKYKN